MKCFAWHLLSGAASPLRLECCCYRLGRMAEGNAVSRSIKWIIARYKSLPAIVLRAIVANLLSTGDLVSDLYTIESLVALGHDGPAYALLTMVCLSLASQVRARLRCRVACATYRDLHAPLALCDLILGLFRRSFWPSS
jgi:hypothetical protein